VGSIKCLSKFRSLGCLLFLLVLVILPVTASVDSTVIPKSKDPLAQDRPDVIAVIKTHVAYVGEAQQARMDGVIHYIALISNDSGTSSLQEIRDDYMTTASSIPLMSTANEITEARNELQAQSRLFSEETKSQMITFNGSFDDLRGNISIPVRIVDDSFNGMKDALWLAKDSARLTVFNTESVQRSLLLDSLEKQGIDISKARNISEQIDAQRVALQKALVDNSAASLRTVNDGIKSMNREFRTAVQEYRTDMQIQMKQAAVLAMGD
jgi:hypothetical protein